MAVTVWALERALAREVSEEVLSDSQWAISKERFWEDHLVLSV